MDTNSQIIFSEEDSDLRTVNWRFNAKGYACTGKRNMMAHQLVIFRMLGYLPCVKCNGLVVDHINRDPKDNRRENLRAVTIRQNTLNSVRFFSADNHAKSARGYYKRGTKFRAYLGPKHLGYFATEKEAAAAVSRARQNANHNKRSRQPYDENE